MTDGWQIRRDTEALRHYLQTMPAPLLVMVACGHVDLTALVLDELEARGMDRHGSWVGSRPVAGTRRPVDEI
jgi:hypothetical protein